MFKFIEKIIEARRIKREGVCKITLSRELFEIKNNTKKRQKLVKRYRELLKKEPVYNGALPCPEKLKDVRDKVIETEQKTEKRRAAERLEDAERYDIHVFKNRGEINGTR